MQMIRSHGGWESFGPGQRGLSQRGLAKGAWAILAHFFAFSFFAKMRKKFWILCKESEENEEIAKDELKIYNQAILY